jgi:hypothetical protein
MKTLRMSALIAIGLISYVAAYRFFATDDTNKAALRQAQQAAAATPISRIPPRRG